MLDHLGTSCERVARRSAAADDGRTDIEPLIGLWSIVKGSVTGRLVTHRGVGMGGVSLPGVHRAAPECADEVGRAIRG